MPCVRQCPSCEHGICLVREHAAKASFALGKVADADAHYGDVRELASALHALDAALYVQQLPPLPAEILKNKCQMTCGEYKRTPSTLEAIRAAISEACQCWQGPRVEFMWEAYERRKAKAAEDVVRRDNDKAKRAQRATLEEQAEFERASRNEPHNLLLVWSAWNAMRRKHVLARRLAEDDICPRILQKHWALGQAFYARQARQLAELVYVGGLFVVATWSQLRRDKRIA